MTIDNFLEDLSDGTPPQLSEGGVGDGNHLIMSQSPSNSDMLPVDDRPVNDGVFHVTQPMNSNKNGDENNRDDNPPEAVSALNNIIHPLLNDQDNKIDEKLQTKILQEELGEARG